MASYFGKDGNYGDAENIVIVDTSDWTEDDWQMIDEAGDTDRASVALGIANRSKVAWSSTLTERMISHLNEHEVSLLINALNDAVEQTCSDYEIQ